MAPLPLEKGLGNVIALFCFFFLSRKEVQPFISLGKPFIRISLPMLSLFYIPSELLCVRRHVSICFASSGMMHQVLNRRLPSFIFYLNLLNLLNFMYYKVLFQSRIISPIPCTLYHCEPLTMLLFLKSATIAVAGHF